MQNMNRFPASTDEAMHLTLLSLALTLLIVPVCLAVASADEPEGLPEIGKLWDFSKPAESENRFRAASTLARAAGDKGFELELQTQIARTQGLRSLFDEAHRTLDEVQKALTPELKKARVRYLLERGRVFNSSGKPAESVPLFKDAWELGSSSGHEDLALDAAHMLGIVEKPDEALRWAEMAIALAVKSQNPRAKSWLGPLYNNTGWTYYERNDFPKALDLLEKAQAVYEQRGTPQQVRIAKYSVGKALRALGKVEQALAIQEKLRAEMETAGKPDGYVYEELAECLLLLKRSTEARPFFAKSHALLSQDEWLAKNEPKRLARLRELASAP